MGHTLQPIVRGGSEETIGAIVHNVLLRWVKGDDRSRTLQLIVGVDQRRRQEPYFTAYCWSGSEETAEECYFIYLSEGKADRQVSCEWQR